MGRRNTKIGLANKSLKRAAYSLPAAGEHAAGADGPPARSLAATR